MCGNCGAFSGDEAFSGGGDEAVGVADTVGITDIADIAAHNDLSGLNAYGGAVKADTYEAAVIDDDYEKATANDDFDIDSADSVYTYDEAIADLIVPQDAPAPQGAYAPQGTPQYGTAPQGTPQYGAAPQGTPPQYGTAPQGTAAPRHGTPDTTFVPKLKKKPRLILIPVIAAVAVLVIGVGAFAAFTFFKRDTLQFIQGSAYAGNYVRGASDGALDDVFDSFAESASYDKGELTIGGDFSLSKEGADKIIAAIKKQGGNIDVLDSVFAEGFTSNSSLVTKYDLSGDLPKMYIQGGVSLNGGKLLSPEVWYDGKTFAAKLPEVSDKILGGKYDISDVSGYSTQSFREVFNALKKSQSAAADPALRGAVKAVVGASLDAVSFKLSNDDKVEVNGKDVAFDTLTADLTLTDIINMGKAAVDEISDNTEYANAFYNVIVSIAPGNTVARADFDALIKNAKSGLAMYGSFGGDSGSTVIATLKLYIDTDNSLAGFSISNADGKVTDDDDDNGNNEYVSNNYAYGATSPQVSASPLNIANGIANAAANTASNTNANTNANAAANTTANVTPLAAMGGLMFGGVGSSGGSEFTVSFAGKPGVGYTARAYVNGGGSFRVFGGYNKSGDKVSGDINLEVYDGDDKMELKLCDFSDVSKNSGTYTFNVSDYIDFARKYFPDDLDNFVSESGIDLNDFSDITCSLAYNKNGGNFDFSVKFNSGAFGISSSSAVGYKADYADTAQPDFDIDAMDIRGSGMSDYAEKLSAWADKDGTNAAIAAITSLGPYGISVGLPTFIGYVEASDRASSASPWGDSSSSSSSWSGSSSSSAEPTADDYGNAARRADYNSRANDVHNMVQSGIDDILSQGRKVRDGVYRAESDPEANGGVGTVRSMSEIVKGIKSYLPEGSACVFYVRDSEVVYVFYSGNGAFYLPDISKDGTYSEYDEDYCGVYPR
ncbi:hypothetical protein FACS1894133_4180 [Clostridia bacterium]|nr:hypothetical protein FACS1894133_4180 [Clostridia bacterium]